MSFCSTSAWHACGSHLAAAGTLSGVDLKCEVNVNSRSLQGFLRHFVSNGEALTISKRQATTYLLKNCRLNRPSASLALPPVESATAGRTFDQDRSKLLFTQNPEIVSQSFTYTEEKLYPFTSTSGLRDQERQLYLPYLEYQLRLMRDKVSGFREVPLPSDYSLKKSSRGLCGAQVNNWVFKSDRLQRVRFSYLDAGDGVQAFNSLCYPHHSLDLPILGMDLLAFGASKIMCVLDFQPISKDPKYLERHFAGVQAIFNKYSDLHTKMSNKHFEPKFFSPCMIIFRSDQGSAEHSLQIPHGRFFHAFVEYLESYLQLLEEAVPDASPAAMQAVASRHDAYDQYLADNDPAIKLLYSYFGVEWTDRYTCDFLFPRARSAH